MVLVYSILVLMSSGWGGFLNVFFGGGLGRLRPLSLVPVCCLVCGSYGCVLFYGFLVNAV